MHELQDRQGGQSEQGPGCVVYARDRFRTLHSAGGAGHATLQAQCGSSPLRLRSLGGIAQGVRLMRSGLLGEDKSPGAPVVRMDGNASFLAYSLCLSSRSERGSCGVGVYLRRVSVDCDIKTKIGLRGPQLCRAESAGDTARQNWEGMPALFSKPSTAFFGA